MKVFVLQHVHVLDEVNEDVKLIGVFSSRLKAEKVIEQYKCLEGFKDSPNGFSIDEYELDQSEWKEGYVTIG